MARASEGGRVWVSTMYLEGAATVTHIEQDEMYPVQVEMDIPDADGHRVYRVTWDELSEQQPEQTVPAAVSFAGPDDEVRYIGKVIEAYKPYGYKVGDMYVLGVAASSYKPGPANIYSVRELGSLRFCGCMGAEIFEVIGEYKETEVQVAPEPVEVAEPEQLSLFDF